MKITISGASIAAASLAVFCLNECALAQDDTELAKQLANPVAALISVPIQLNYDDSYGPTG